MNKSLLIIFLSLILLLAAATRLIGLGSFPGGVTGDEIQQGYTGYSILKTGRDEWGDFLPINPRGFGDYKPPLYAYSTVLSEAIMGLNITAVRLPSAVAGILTVLVIFYLGKMLFKSHQVGLLAALFLSISSWHVFYSRIGWESNLGLFLTSVGLLFFVKSFTKNSYLVLSALSFGLAASTYPSFKVFVPLLVVSSIIIYWKNLRLYNRQQLYASGVVFSLLFLIVIHSFLFAGGGSRASTEGIFSKQYLANLRDIQVNDKLPNPWNRIINNKTDFLITQFFQNYLGYFSTSFLTSPFRSDSTLFNLSARGVSGIWLIPIWEILLFLGGLFFLIKDKIFGRWLVVSWLLLSPIPASLAHDYMHAQRAESLLFVFPLLAAFGLIKVFGYLNSFKYKKILVLFLAVFVIWTSIKDADFYLFHEFRGSIGGVHYGYKEIVDYVEANKSKYDKIVFTKNFSEPQAFVAFYSQMDPSYFQSQSQDWKSFESKGLAFLDIMNFSLGKYSFKNIEYNNDKSLKRTLIIGSREEIPQEIPVKFIYNDPNNSPVFVAVESVN